MALRLDKAHVTVKDASGNMKIVGLNPYKRFIGKDLPYPIIVQGGRFYTDGGDSVPFKDVPDGVISQLNSMSSQAREKVGLSPEPIDQNTLNDLPALEDSPKEEYSNFESKSEGLMSIVDAVYSLDSTNNNLWTKDGKPNINAVSRLIGQSTTRAEIEEVTDSYRRPSQE